MRDILRGHQGRTRSAIRQAALGVIVALLGACGSSRDAVQVDETVPRITPTATASSSAPTSPPTTVPATTVPATTMPPATTPSTASPTVPATPWPTSLTTDSATTAPAVPPTGPPPSTQPPATTQRAPSATAPSAPAPTSTVVVTAATPAICSAEAIGADTGDLTIENVSCTAGWAIGLIDECPAGVACEGVDVFHFTGSGWVHDGYFPAVCAEGLTGAGMSIYTAVAFVSNVCGESPAGTAVIRPESTGDRVIHLQTALIAEGYELAVDGTYGPSTQGAVRDFQQRNQLEVDGIAGPETQAALGIGPGGERATSPTELSAPSPPGATTTSTVALAPAEPATCDAATIGADVDMTIVEIRSCQAGWAIGRIDECPSSTACEDVDVFHVTENGWVSDGNIGSLCAEELTGVGMSPYTATAFGPFCGADAPAADREIISPDSTGDDVRHVQIALIALGYPIDADGTYGPRTQAAVRDYQAANGLEVDGIAGPRTRTTLGV